MTRFLLAALAGALTAWAVPPSAAAGGGCPNTACNVDYSYCALTDLPTECHPGTNCRTSLCSAAGGETEDEWTERKRQALEEGLK